VGHKPKYDPEILKREHKSKTFNYKSKIQETFSKWKKIVDLLA